jgi:hypothetical protein
MRTFFMKNTYILILLLNVVAPGIEALIISGNKLLYACVEEVCELSHVLTPSINFLLLLQSCDPNQLFR